MSARRVNFIVLLFMLPALLCAEYRVRIFGYVLDEDNRGIELANAYIEGTTIGTTTNRNGYYDLQFPSQDSVTIVFSMLGYQTIRQTILLSRDVLQANVVLSSDNEILEEVEVKGIRTQIGTMEQLEVQNTRLMPDASGGNIESILITFAGVSQTNELSSQYNVRGGNFDENEVYVNGIEIHRPLLIRAGQQEGLSFVNPDMVQNLSFSAGGFEPKYGDKMSSVLDIEYKKPDRFEASLSAGLLGASAYVGSGNERYSMMHGIRYKTSRYMLGALPTKGKYNPDFVDYQTYITWKLDKSSRWEMSLLGNFSQNLYRFQPDTISSGFGTFTVPMKMEASFEGQEKDRFRTAFAALGVRGQLNRELRIAFDISGFYTDETESYDITCEYWLKEGQKDADATGKTTTAEADTENASAQILGSGLYHEHARNRLQAGVVTLAHSGQWQRSSNNLQWGTSLQAELLTDHISEWEWRDSMGYSLPTQFDTLQLYSSLKADNRMQSLRWQGYVQDTYKWQTDAGNLILTGGLRFNWWSYNKEFLCSPRVSLSYIPGWKRDFAFRLATGLYYQAPFYKELRQTAVAADGTSQIVLNNNIRAQRSVHIVLGGDYYFRAWGRPFKLTAEAYYKYMDRVISYTVDNVRVRYSGENDATAYTVGGDLKLYGELVPGADSWISLSAMRSRENLLYDTQGWISAPQEQRFTFSMYFQDYIPRFPQYRVHLKTLVSDGFPYGNPKLDNTRAQFRIPTYWRIDIGASATFSRKTDAWMRKQQHVESWAVLFEVFNLTDHQNVNSHFWITDGTGIQWAFPNRLTGRMFNLRATINFQ